MAIASQSKKLKDAKLSLKDVKVYLNLHSFLDVSFRACLLLSCFAVADENSLLSLVGGNNIECVVSTTGWVVVTTTTTTLSGCIRYEVHTRFTWFAAIQNERVYLPNSMQS